MVVRVGGTESGTAGQVVRWPVGCCDLVDGGVVAVTGLSGKPRRGGQSAGDNRTRDAVDVVVDADAVGLETTAVDLRTGRAGPDINSAEVVVGQQRTGQESFGPGLGALLDPVNKRMIGQGTWEHMCRRSTSQKGWERRGRGWIKTKGGQKKKEKEKKK